MLLGVFVLFALGATAPALGMNNEGGSNTPWIASDQADYAPGAAVTLTGGNWQPGESVHINVNDDQGQTWSRDVDVTASGTGGVTDSFNLPEWFVATYSVKATGASGAVATTTFTDGTMDFQLATAGNDAPANLTWSVNWDQWQGTGQAPNTNCAGTRTTNGTASFTGNVLSSGSRPGINDNASAKPTDAQATLTFASTYTFDYWSASAASTTALSATAMCKAGTNGPTVVTLYAHFKLSSQNTSITDVSGTGVYAGTGTLTAKLTSGGSGLSGKTVSFTVNSGSAGSAVTNSDGVATLSGVSLSGINAGTYVGAVGASFAAGGGFNGSNGSGNLVVGKADQAALVLSVPANITYGNTGTASTTGGSGTGARTFSGGASTGCSVDAMTGMISVTNASGTCSISASKAGDSNYNGPVSDGPTAVTLNKANQAALVLSVPASITYGDTGDASTTGGTGLGVVSFSHGASTGCSVNSSTGLISVTNASGTCSISATKAGTDNYNPVSDGPTAVTLNKANQATLTVAAPNAGTFGQFYDMTASGGSGDGALSFNVVSGGCAIVTAAGPNQGKLEITSGTGSCKITAHKAGNANYNPVDSGEHTVSLNKANQAALVLSTPGSITYGDTGDASTTGGSGIGAVSFSDGASTGCTVNSSTGLISVSNASGTCSISASKAGDDNYNGPVSAGPAAVTLVKANQAALVLSTPGSITYGDTGDASTTGGSGTGAVSFSDGASTGCTVNSSTGLISVTNASGTCSLSATKAGDNNHNPTSDGPNTVTLNKANQAALVLSVPANITYGNTGAASTTGGSGTGARTFSDGASTGCWVDAMTGVISVTNASGTCSISASKAGDDNYNGPVSAGPTAVTLVKANQAALNVTAPSTGTFGQAYTMTASGGNGTGALSFDASGSACEIPSTGPDAGKLTITSGTGTCSITAHKAGDDNYNQANSAAFPVTVQKANQTITFAAFLTGKKLGDPDFTVSATASSGLSVEFGSQTPGVCTVSGAMVHIVAVGTCTVRATQGGNANYNPATPVDRSFAVTYVFTGFFKPIDMFDAANKLVLNRVKAGSAVPVKFSLNGDQGLSIFELGFPKTVVITCDPAAVVEPISEAETVTAGSSSLAYDATAGQYVYVWKTEKSWTGCRQLQVKFTDGVQVNANFQLTK